MVIVPVPPPIHRLATFGFELVLVGQLQGGLNQARLHARNKDAERGRVGEIK